MYKTTSIDQFSSTKILKSGFSMIELMVVLAIIAILLTLVAPRYLGSVASGKETVLKENLSTVRRAIDQHFADRGAFPKKLEDLVTLQYLRSLPIDPITNSSESWILIGENAAPIEVVSNSSSTAPPLGAGKPIRDVKSGAPGSARDGELFSKW
jgi:general secretion pathway protein G